MRRIAARVLLLIAASTVVLGNAVAVTELDLHIEAEFPACDHPATSYFVASGGAVDLGYFPPVGTILQHEASAVADVEPPLFLLVLDKMVISDGSSDSIGIHVEVWVHSDTGYSVGDWGITGGTGTYAGIEGAGTIEGVTGSNPCLVDTYDGWIDVSAMPTVEPSQQFGDITITGLEGASGQFANDRALAYDSMMYGKPSYHLLIANEFYGTIAWEPAGDDPEASWKLLINDQQDTGMVAATFSNTADTEIPPCSGWTLAAGTPGPDQWGTPTLLGGASCEGGDPGSVACTQDSDCFSGACDLVTGLCVNDLCNNGQHDDGETDVDCGGDCPPCDNGDPCLSDTECGSGFFCVLGQCETSPGTCQNGILDDDETDVDCGGVCDQCVAGDSCLENADCHSGVCSAGVCEDPTCQDGTLNGDEIGVDCGGACESCSGSDACTQDSDCFSGACDLVIGLCVDNQCSNGQQDDGETDVDCGGVCPPCNNGDPCLTDAECPSGSFCVGGYCQTTSTQCGAGMTECGGLCRDVSTDPDHCGVCGNACEGNGVCMSGACQAAYAPGCTDQIQNGDETGVDCGGACEPCSYFVACTQDSDCFSGACDLVTGLCVDDQCSNGQQDDGETDVDCGGPCGPCETGGSCLSDADCNPGFCVFGHCEPHPSTCMNGVIDPDETDIDCGGVCDLCVAGDICLEKADCHSGVCLAGICQDATCQDGTLNSDEIDIDCGGSCSPCGMGQDCSSGVDCASGFCVGGECVASGSISLCGNGERDGDETDTDCGGTYCDPCELDEQCIADSDCLTGFCVFGHCTAYPGTCENGTLDDEESDVDCGGPCMACATGQACEDDADCMSGSCNAGTGLCDAPTCGNGQIDSTETDLDCGGDCQTCTGGRVCLADADCESGSCVGGICSVPVTCSNGVLDAEETDIDCGGPCAPCDDGKVCEAYHDCLSNVCINWLCQAPSCSDGVQNGAETARDCGGDCAVCEWPTWVDPVLAFAQAR